MELDPKISMIINIVLAVLGVLAGAGAYWTSMFGAGRGQAIVGTIGLVLAIVAAINATLHGYSSAQAGPMVSDNGVSLPIPPPMGSR
jgi:FtsH-binding integral membrane protein